MPRYIKLKNHSWKNFRIAQAEPKPAKLGVGPYALYFDEKEIVRFPRERDCRDYLENVVREKKQFDMQIHQLKSEFCKKSQLPRYPEF